MLILDTHIFLWAAENPKKLPQKARDTLLDPSIQLFVSAASLWEISIKISLKRLKFPITEVKDVLESIGASYLPIEIEDFEILQKLPPIHKDPFDRMLLAQTSRVNGRLMTADRMIAKYSQIDLVLV